MRAKVVVDGECVEAFCGRLPRSAAYQGVSSTFATVLPTWSRMLARSDHRSR